MLSDFQKRKFRVLFDHLDSNGNGVLQWRDIVIHMESIKKQKGWSDDNIKFIRLMTAEIGYWNKMLERVDADGDGVVTTDEFERFYASIAAEINKSGEVPSWAVELLEAKHRVLDIDGNGSISLEEYAIYLTAIKCQANHAEVFAKLDLNGDGAIAFDEMEALFRQFVLSTNPADPGNYLMCGVCN